MAGYTCFFFLLIFSLFVCFLFLGLFVCYLFGWLVSLFVSLLVGSKKLVAQVQLVPQRSHWLRPAAKGVPTRCSAIVRESPGWDVGNRNWFLWGMWSFLKKMGRFFYMNNIYKKLYIYIYVHAWLYVHLYPMMYYSNDIDLMLPRFRDDSRFSGCSDCRWCFSLPWRWNSWGS